MCTSPPASLRRPRSCSSNECVLRSRFLQRRRSSAEPTPPPPRPARPRTRRPTCASESSWWREDTSIRPRPVRRRAFEACAPLAGAIEKQRPVSGARLDLCIFPEFIPRRDHHPVGGGGDGGAPLVVVDEPAGAIDDARC